MRRIPTETGNRAVAFSGTVFRHLLVVYPKAYRREYGEPMAQLFRDQCRESWRTAGGLGLARLWLRVLPDLMKTSMQEHISTLKERNSMPDRISPLLRSSPRSVFFAVFAVVFLLVVGSCVLTTLLLPDTYASTVLMKAGWTVSGRAGQAEFDAIESEPVLDKVISVLDLNKAWGRRYARGVPFETSKTRDLLRKRIDLRPVRSTPLIEIRVFSEDRDEAAALANAIASSYREYRPFSKVEIVSTGVPGLRPLRPNRPLNIALGVLGGLFFASVAGAAITGFTAFMAKRSHEAGPPSGKTAATLPEV